jgi:hypothetical protein
MAAAPVHGEPALVVDVDRECVLVVADLHLGVESELAEGGVGLPSQIPKVKERLLKLIGRHEPDRLIFLGDVKHNVPIISWQEWRDLPSLLAELTKLVRVEILPGNHDGDIKGLAPPEVTIHGPRGIVLGKRERIGLMHGHTWPDPKLLSTKLLVIAHNHPAIEFRDKLGMRTVEPAWLRCKLKPSKFPARLRDKIKGKGPELMVMPAFGELIGGASVNRRIPEELLGPMFKAGAVALDDAEVYLLDGTFLGTVANLRELRK